MTLQYVIHIKFTFILIMFERVFELVEGIFWLDQEKAGEIKEKAAG